MAESLDDVMRRVRKLLKLARSDNPHEAASAMAHAQRLLLKHGLEASEVEREPSAVADGGAVQVGSVLEKWCLRLADAVARANQCRALFVTTWPAGVRQKAINMFGHADDLTKARYLYGYYFDETQRLTRVHARGKGRTWANSFRHGVIDALVVALAAVVREVRAEATSTAIIRLDSRGGEVDDFVAAKGPKKSINASPTNQDTIARLRGQAAGRTIAKSDARAGMDKGGAA